MNTPFQWTKQVASHWGGTRNGTIVHWPNGIEEPGGLRSQFTHVIDVAPTILEAAGLPEPTMVNGVLQSPMEGTSMLYTFNEADAPERHDLQYFEMFGNRGIYHQGWSAVTKHKTPWVMVGGVLPAFDDDVWELYDGNSDYSQARNLAAEQPEMLAKLQRLWLIEATKYNVLPLDDRTARAARTAELAGRPTLIRGDSQLFFAGHGPALGEQRGQHQEQVVLGHRRGRGPRRRRRRRDHRPGRPLRRLGRLRQGRQGQVRLQRARHPGVRHRGRHADPGRAPTRCGWSSPTTAAGWPRAATSPCTTTAQQSAPAGSRPPSRWSSRPTRPPTSATSPAPPSPPTTPPQTSRFTGKIHWVQLDLGNDDHDHFIDPEERLRIAMARQ